MRSVSGFHLAHDKKHVYWRSTPLADSDGSTFKKLSNDYFKNANAVWATAIDKKGNTSWVKLATADIATFKIIDPTKGIGQDKNHTYRNGDFYTEPETKK